MVIYILVGVGAALVGGLLVYMILTMKPKPTAPVLPTTTTTEPTKQ